MTDKVKAALKASKKLDERAKSDILDLLGQFEGELQAKDIVIASLKSECLKHLLNNFNKASLNDPHLALGRDSAKKIQANKCSNSECSSGSGTTSNDQTAHKLVALCNLVESQKSTLQRLTSCLSEADKQRSSLLRDLEEERRKNAELSKQFKEQQDKIDRIETQNLESQNQNDNSEIPAEDLKKLQATLNNERQNTKEMILVLMEDRRKMASLFMEEKRRSEELTRQLREEKSRVRALGLGLEEESKRSLAMEAELERHLVQITSQADDLQKARINAKDLEDALRKARSDAEHFKKQLSEAHRVAMSQASAAQQPIYGDALSAIAVSSAASASSSISPSSTSSLGGLTASSLVTAAIGKQSLGVNYEVYASSQTQPQISSQPVPKSRTTQMSATSTMRAGGHRVVPNVNESNGGVGSTLNRITNSFQVNGQSGSGPSKKAGPPVPPNKPSVSIYKPLAKLEGIVNSPADAK